jgi:hypothetical protein
MRGLASPGASPLGDFPVIYYRKAAMARIEHLQPFLVAAAPLALLAVIAAGYTACDRKLERLALVVVYGGAAIGLLVGYYYTPNLF